MVEDLYKDLKKKYGLKIAWGRDLPPQEYLSTQSLDMDIAFGGGFPMGKLTTLAGEPSSGKTAAAYHGIAEGQARFPDKGTAMISLEQPDMGWARTNGVDVDKLLLINPNSSEEAIDMYVDLVESRQFSVVVFDSIGAIMPKSEVEDSAEKSLVGSGMTTPRLIGRLVNKTGLALNPNKEHYNNTVAIFLNHIYGKPDQWKPWEIGGGKKLRFGSALIAVFLYPKYVYSEQKDGKDDRSSQKLGIEVSVQVEKDKTVGVPPSFHFTLFNQDGWNGIAKAGTYYNLDSIIRFGQELPTPADPFINKNGAWYTINGEKMQGDSRVAAYLHDNPDVAADLEAKIRSLVFQKDFET